MYVLHIVRMWPHATDPQHGSFVQAHIQSLQEVGIEKQGVLVWDGQSTALLSGEITANISRPKNTRFWAKWRQLRHCLEQDTPQILHVHGGGWDSSAAMLLCHMLFGSRIRRVVTEHQSHWLYTPHPGAVWTARLAHARTAVSPWLARHIIKSVGTDQSMHFIPNCLKAPSLPLERSQATHRRFLWVGDMVPIKQFDQLLEAWDTHHLQFPKDHLTVMGSGPEALLLFPKQPGRTYFGPAIPREVHKAMLHHDILIVHSLQETFSMVIGEALERGMAVLSTPLQAVKDIYGEGGNLHIREDFSLANLQEHMARSEKAMAPPPVFQDYRETAVGKAFRVLYDQLWIGEKTK